METQNKNKTLGISIPTYKRPEFLKKCVLSAIEAANGVAIKIFIVDDSVSDVNKDVIDELTNTYDFIHYKKNSANIGIDKNISSSVDFCDCDYSWIIGEDDLFLPGAIERVYNTIQDKDYEFIFSNYAYAGEDHSLLNTALPHLTEDEFEVKKFIEENLWVIGFIGACVIKKSAWNKTSPEPYEGTYYTHVGRIVDLIATEKYIYALQEPNIANRSKGADTFTWKSDSFGVFLGFENMCKAVAEHIPTLRDSMQKAINKYRAEIGYFSMITPVRLRAEQSFDVHQYNKYVLNSDISKSKKMYFYIISITPSALLKPLLSLYRKIKHV